MLSILSWQDLYNTLMQVLEMAYNGFKTYMFLNLQNIC